MLLDDRYQTLRVEKELVHEFFNTLFLQNRHVVMGYPRTSCKRSGVVTDFCDINHISSDAKSKYTHKYSHQSALVHQTAKTYPIKYGKHPYPQCHTSNYLENYQ